MSAHSPQTGIPPVMLDQPASAWATWLREIARTVNQLVQVNNQPTQVQSVQAASPTGTSSTSFVMMGLAVSFTPSTLVTIDRALVTTTGMIGNTASNGQTYFQLTYGTGTAPVNGAAQTGTLLGLSIMFTAAQPNDYAPFSQTAVMTGLSPGITYWIDLAVRVTSGTSIANGIQLVAHGI